MKRLLTPALMMMLLTSVGCASSAAQQTEQPGYNGGGDDDLVERRDDEGEDDRRDSEGANLTPRCEDDSLRLAGGFNLFEQGEFRLRGHDFKLYLDDSKRDQVSFCDILDRERAKVAIFQFAGVDCKECFEHSEEIQDFKKEYRHGDDIVHVLVMTDFFEDYPNFSDFERFQDNWARDSFMAFDESRWWKHFSEDPSLPIRTTTIIMNLDMDAIVINKEGQHSKIFAAAENLMDDYLDRFDQED